MYKLEMLRLENHLTCKQMGEKLGISRPFYRNLEKRSRTLSYDMAIKIANIFGLKPDNLFYEDYTNDKKEPTIR